MQKLAEIKIVICDIDGTLLNGSTLLNESTVSVIQKLKQYNIDFVFASGRLPSRIRPLSHQLGLENMFVVSCNGALVYKGDKILFENYFPAILLNNLVKKATELDMTVLYSTDGIEYCHQETTDSRRKRKERGSYFEVKPLDFQGKNLIKLNILTDNQLDLLTSELSKIEHLVNITRYGNFGVEIVNRNVSKKTGVDFYSQYTKQPFQTMMAIGDNENDIELFESAGLAIAVANASRETKAYADYVTDAVSASGVEEILYKLIDAKKLKQKEDI